MPDAEPPNGAHAPQHGATLPMARRTGERPALNPLAPGDAPTWRDGPLLPPDLVTRGGPWPVPPASGSLVRIGHARGHRRWVVLALVAVLLLAAGGGASFVVVRAQGPANAAARFCADLRSRQYANAYALLASGQRARVSESVYSQLLGQLDTLEGTVSACGQDGGGGAFEFPFGAGSASVTVALSRAHAGALRGALHLVSESGGWKIAAIDTALLGVNLGALQVSNIYCQALRTQNYTTAFALLSSAARDDASAAQFQSISRVQDQVDGKVRTCAPIGLGVTNTDAAAQIVLGIARARLGQRKGTLALSFTKGRWLIAALDPQLVGTSLTALFVAIRWCGDITAGNFADAYNLSVAKAKESLAQFRSSLDGPQTVQGQTFFFQWTVCKADASTYTLNGSGATIVAAATWVVTINGQTLTENYAVPLVFIWVGRAWLWSGIGTPTPAK